MDAFDIKEILGISPNNFEHDDYIETCIPLFTEFIQDICNNNFLNNEGNVQLRGGAKIALAKMIEFNMQKSGVASRSFGEVSYSYSLDFPKSIISLLSPYNRIKV
jgi:hypothetical protein